MLYRVKSHQCKVQKFSIHIHHRWYNLFCSQFVLRTEIKSREMKSRSMNFSGEKHFKYNIHQYYPYILKISLYELSFYSKWWIRQGEARLKGFETNYHPLQKRDLFRTQTGTVERLESTTRHLTIKPSTKGTIRVSDPRHQGLPS